MRYSINYAIDIRKLDDGEQERYAKHYIGQELGHSFGNKIAEDMVNGKIKGEVRSDTNTIVYTHNIHVLTDAEYRDMINRCIAEARIQMERGLPLMMPIKES